MTSGPKHKQQWNIETVSQYRPQLLENGQCSNKTALATLPTLAIFFAHLSLSLSLTEMMSTWTLKFTWGSCIHSWFFLRGLYELDFVVLTQNQISTTLLRLVEQSVMTSGESFWGLSSRRQDLLLLHHSLLFLLNQLDWSRPLSPACEQQIITREH